MSIPGERRQQRSEGWHLTKTITTQNLFDSDGRCSLTVSGWIDIFVAK